jgi:hypothetical protein
MQAQLHRVGLSVFRSRMGAALAGLAAVAVVALVFAFVAVRYFRWE